MSPLEGKVAFVTGASGGNRRGGRRELAEHGVKVGLASSAATTSASVWA